MKPEKAQRLKDILIKNIQEKTRIFLISIICEI